MDAEAKSTLENMSAVLDELDAQRAHSVAAIVEGLEKVKLMFVRRGEMFARENASAAEKQQAVFNSELQEVQSKESLLREEISRLTAELADRDALADKLASLERQLSDYEEVKQNNQIKEQQIRELEEQLQSRGEIIQEKEAVLADKEALLAEKDSALLRHEEIFREKEAELTSREEEIAAVNETLEASRQTCAAVREELDQLKLDYSALGDEHSAIRQEREELHARLQEREQEIQQLAEEIQAAAVARQMADEIQQALEEKEKRIQSLESALQDAAESSDKYEVQTKMLLDQLENFRQQREEMTALRDQLKQAEAALEKERADSIRLRARAAVAGRLSDTAGDKTGVPLSARQVYESVSSATQEKRPSPTRASQRKLFGEILCDAGVVTGEQLEEALRFKASGFKRRIGSVFIELGYATSEVIAAALAAQLSLPFVEKLEAMATTEAIRLVPAYLVKNHRCLPISKDGKRLRVAMENPLDLIAIEDIELATGCTVEPAVATSDAITSAIERFYAV